MQVPREREAFSRHLFFAVLCPLSERRVTQGTNPHSVYAVPSAFGTVFL